MNASEQLKKLTEDESAKASSAFNSIVNFDPTLLPLVSSIFLYHRSLNPKLLEAIDQIPATVVPTQEVEVLLLSALSTNSYRDQLIYVEQLERQSSKYAEAAKTFVENNMNDETFGELFSQTLEAYKKDDAKRAATLLNSFQSKSSAVLGGGESDIKAYTDNQNQLFYGGLDLLRQQPSNALFNELFELSATENQRLTLLGILRRWNSDQALPVIEKVISELHRDALQDQEFKSKFLKAFFDPSLADQKLNALQNIGALAGGNEIIEVIRTLKVNLLKDEKFLMTEEGQAGIDKITKFFADREASLRLYTKRLSEMLPHLSNRKVDQMRVVAGLAELKNVP